MIFKLNARLFVLLAALKNIVHTKYTYITPSILKLLTGAFKILRNKRL